MSDEARTLIEAIVAAPDEDSPRLVYADWLLAGGERLGELIVAQLQQARSPEDLALRRRVAGLISAHKAAVLGDLPVSRPVFRRGFVEVVEIDAVDFLTLGTGLFERLPLLSELRIWCDRSQPPAELARSPLFARLRRLAIRFGPGLSLTALANNPALATLEALELTGCNLDARACGALANSPHLGALRSLELGFDPIGALGIGRLAAADWAPQLHRLVLRNAELGPGATRWLGGFAALEALVLEVNGLDLAALESLALVAGSLRELSLRGEALGAPMIEALTPLTLTELDLDGAAIGDAGVPQLGRLDLGALETLVLSGNELTTSGVQALARLPLPRLRRLILRHNQLGSCARVFSDKFTHTRVELDAKVWLPGR